MASAFRVAGVDVGGTSTAINFCNSKLEFAFDKVVEVPSDFKQGPKACFDAIANGLKQCADLAGISLKRIQSVGLDTPGPASASGVMSVRGSTNAGHKEWANYDIRRGLERRLGVPVVYGNDGNFAARWAHTTKYGLRDTKHISVSAVVGTGLGGGIISGGQMVTGSRGEGAELGHLLLPYQDVLGGLPIVPVCNCGRTGDVESLASLTAIRNSLLPYFLGRPEYRNHPLRQYKSIDEASKYVRKLAAKGDELCLDIFRIQARALAALFDQMMMTFDADSLFVGGGVVESSVKFRKWFLSEIRGHIRLWPEQEDVTVSVIPHGDQAGSRGAALAALLAL
jgi:predicted NBD/HSP70 family sugar kinase